MGVCGCEGRVCMGVSGVWVWGRVCVGVGEGVYGC